MRFILLGLILGGCMFAQNSDLTKPPIVLAPQLNDYVETFPTTSFATPNSPLVTSKPIKVGTLVIISVDGLVTTPLRYFIKTTEAITVTLSSDQINPNTHVVIAYKSEQ